MTNPAIDKIILARAIAKLSPYFQLTNARDVSEVIALQQLQGFTGALPNEQLRPLREITNLIDTLINTTDGCGTTFEIIKELARSLEGGSNAPINSSQTLTNRLVNFVRIFYAGTENRERVPFFHANLPLAMGRGEGQSGIINGTPQNPNKENPGLSLIQINTTQVMPTHKHANEITVFMNGIPDIELARSVPFVNVQFFFGREPLDSNNRVQTMSLVKFLQGAVDTTGNGVLQLLVDGNTVPGSIEGANNTSGFLSTAGMELFSSPQTLVNANEHFDNSLRATPVIDKFRPFMSFKSLNVEIQSAGAGLISYKNAKMDFVLHDRSRLHEIADFIKPDLYGTTELMLEYGWSHPDKLEINNNPYGILINGMRCKEKYGIRNMSLAFEEGGEVGITLDLYMKGGNEFTTEMISSDEEGVNNILREIQRLSRLVSAYEQRLFRGNTRTREIRGAQILEAAGDSQGQLRLTPEILRNLNDFQRSLNTRSLAGNQTAHNLVASLRELYTQRTQPGQPQGALQELSTTVQTNIERKLARVLGRASIDPFQPENINIANTSLRYLSRRHLGATRNDNSGAGNTRVVPLREPQVASDYISLGKLMLLFVGEPLALTKKWDDIQFLFYPFNQYAGFANTLNISQFLVDTRYFVQQYTRYRTENASRAANMNLKDFMVFIAGTIIDDPGASVYGISDLYEEVRNRQTSESTVQPRGNAVEFQTRLEERLRSRTPDATFKMPQVDIHIETVPGKRVVNETTTELALEKSILRIHVYDKQATSYESQASILAANREETLTAIGTLPQAVNDGEAGIRDSHEATARSIISLAQSENLLEPIQGNGGEHRSYRINGGPKAIKDFVMKTMPYMIYGTAGTGIKRFGFSSMQDSNLSTVNMLRSFRAGPLLSNGEQPGGLPLSIIPCQGDLTVIGCPLFDFAQQFFLDMQTGTSLENVYGIVHVNHTLTPGNFETALKVVPIDAYGRYNSMIERVNQAANYVSSINGSQNNTNQTTPNR